MINVVDMCMGSGKAQPLDCGVLTEHGFKQMGDIHVGDRVFGEDGKLHNVLGVFPQGVKSVYKVTFSDRTSTRCCGDHLWTYQTPQDKYKGKFRTETLDEIREHGLYTDTNRGHKNWRVFIPITKPVEFAEKEYEIDPYVIGALLGDGGLTDNVSFTNEEDDVCAKLQQRLGNTATVKHSSKQRDDEYQIVSSSKDELGRSVLKNKLRTLGMMGCSSIDKRVPPEYLVGSINQRLDLIQGLMDTDGTISQDGKYAFSTISEHLATDMQYLIQSVGGTATIWVKRHPFYTKDGARVYCNPCFVLYIKVPDGIPIVSSKKHLARAGRERKSGPVRSMRSIEYCGEEECQCILIDSPSHLYITDNFLVTHNTSAAITFMNEHTDKLYMYVTPFLDETERIKNACSGLRFVEPSDRIPDYRHSKRMHLRALVNQRRNVAITHALFKIIDDVTAQAIVDNGYTIIIDEVIDVFEPMNESEDDMDMLLAGGFLDKLGGDSECEYYRPSEKAKTYKSGVFNEFFSKAQFGQIVRTNGWDSGKPAKYGFWQLNRRLFTLSDEIYILTYLFDGMPLRGFLESNGFKYRRIGTMKCDDGKYRFCEHGVIPPYVEHLKDMVHVCDKDSINAIGDGKRALSVNWCRTARKDGRMAQLSRHVYTFFRNHVPQWIGADQRLWSTYKDARKDVEGKGFTDSFLSYNCEATNKYGDRAALAYCVNIFPNPNLQSYLEHIGVKMDWDQYALAIMIQWVWRSRIRNGQEIWLYVPSRRMRELFLKWMDDAVAAYQKEQEVTDKNGQGETALV